MRANLQINAFALHRYFEKISSWHIVGTSFMKSDLVVTTSTWYSEPCIRSRCAIQFVKNCAENGIAVVVVDGGSYKSFREEVLATGKDFVTFLDEVEHTKGLLGPGRRQAIQAGFEITGGKLSGYCEAEKMDMPRFIASFCRPILDGETDIVFPARSEQSFKTYPTAQQWTERAGDLQWRQATGLDWDAYFGPRWYNAAAGKFVLEYDDAYGGMWDATLLPLLRCAASGLHVTNPKIDYIHPAEQTAEEENSSAYTRKRFEQLVNVAKAAEAEAKRLRIGTTTK